MNKVTTVNLNGNAYVLEENGYEALHAYLGSAALRLEKNPDKDEILADLERAIAEKFRGLLGKNKTVVLAKEVAAIIEEMGPVQDDLADAETASASTASASSGKPSPEKADQSGAGSGQSSQTNDGPVRRLYKIPEGAMIAGVCNGFAAYFHLDVILIRTFLAAVVAVVALFTLLVHGFILIPFLILTITYSILALVLPTADTAAERAAARGDPFTAEEYIRRAKQGYYDSVKIFKDRASRKKWKQDFKQEMRRHAYQAKHYAKYDWTQDARAVHMPSFALPVLGLMEFTLLIGTIALVLALIKNGAVFGVGLPDGVPLWIGIVAVIFVFHVAVWPLKALRHACYFNATGRSGYGFFGGFVDSVVWLAAVVAAVWLADHYIPQVHEFIQTLPEKLDHFTDGIRQWWMHRRGEFS